jgi:MFS family permease
MATAETPKRMFYGWYVVATVVFINFIGIGPRSGFGLFVKPMSEELGWDRATISLAAALGVLVGGVMQPFTGHVFDRYGGRRVITLSLGAVGLATLALTWTSNLAYLIVMYSFVLSVAFSGAGGSVVNVLVTRWFQRRRGTAIAVTSMGASLGQLILIPFAMYLMVLVGWRNTWLVLGLSVVALAMPLAWFLLRDDPAEVGARPDGDGELSVEGARAAQRRGPLEVTEWRDAFRSAPIWEILGGYFVCGFTTNILSTHFVPFALDRGLSGAAAATAFGIMGALNIVGVFAAGYLSDRMSRKKLLALVYAVRGTAYAVLLLVHAPWALYAFVVIAGVSWLATIPLTTGLTADIYGLKRLGTLAGIVLMAHQAGGAISIYFAGWIFDRTGSYDVAWGIAAVLLLFATLSAVVIPEKRYSVRYQPVQAAAEP